MVKYPHHSSLLPLLFCNNQPINNREWHFVITDTEIFNRESGIKMKRLPDMEQIYQQDLMALFEEFKLPFLLTNPGDIATFFDKLVPQNLDLYEHKAEGVDDMPAHIKASLTSTHLSIPIRNKKIDLGTWQGIFLFEHRIQSHTREIDIHIIGTH